MPEAWERRSLALTAGACSVISVAGVAGAAWFLQRERPGWRRPPAIVSRRRVDSPLEKHKEPPSPDTPTSHTRQVARMVRRLSRGNLAEDPEHYINQNSRKDSFSGPDINKVEPMVVRKSLTLNRRRLVVAMVGLPARGKSFLSSRITAFFTWQGAKTRVFNVGQTRRVSHDKDEKKYMSGQDADYFDPNNITAKEKREAIASSVLNQLLEWLDAQADWPSVAIFDATNSTALRRRRVHETVKAHNAAYDVIFVESLCDDPEVLEANIRMKCTNSPDYKGMTFEEAKKDFEARIDRYKSAYETLDNDGKSEADLSYIKMLNMSAHLVAHNVYGRRALSLLPFLMALHIGKRPVWLVRMPQAQKQSRMGFRQWLFPQALAQSFGDQPMSQDGMVFATKFASFARQHSSFRAARIISCSHRRALQTAEMLDSIGERTHVRAHLNPMEWGCYNGIPRKDFAKKTSAQFQQDFNRDPLRTRFPGGESYEDFVRRLTPVLVEVEQQVEPVIIIAPISTLQVLHCYFGDVPLAKAPEIKIDVHTVFQWKPQGGSFNLRVISESELV